ncbi:LytR/AlgR family response regulator transcription factor [Comamonas composti]|uniref:LytR/AlgR family response regulator transcription factor n=1 Tax=Comamonas composti TaxID=408558 RepID=UPI00040EBC70|nr:LytTR family DNA-binding domain-containing protein [Comamonas composti]
MQARALIAEDEPLLAQDLCHSLALAWPALQIAAVTGDGLSAVHKALDLRPDVLFFDIRMPGQGGLEAAAELAEAWPEALPFPVLVFVTAYDQYAMAAFDAQALDYVLKPVQPQRLALTVKRIQQRLAQCRSGRLESTLEQLRELMHQASAPASPRLQLIQVGMGHQIQMLPLSEVVYFEASDKYLRVLTARHEYLLRMPLKELLPQLDPEMFWQIHRGTVVRASSIACAQRDEASRLWLSLRDRPERLAVSRLYATRFKAM